MEENEVVEVNEIKVEETKEAEEVTTEIPEEPKTKRKRGRPAVDVPEMKESESKFQPGDRVKIAASIGASLEGKLITPSERNEFYYVLAEDHNIVRVHNQSKSITRLFSAEHLRKA